MVEHFRNKAKWAYSAFSNYKTQTRQNKIISCSLFEAGLHGQRPEHRDIEREREREIERERERE